MSDEMGNMEGMEPETEPPVGGPPSKDACTFAMLAHLLGALLCFIGPLVIWLIKKDESTFVDDQGKEALNFQITILIGYVIASVLSVFCIGLLLYPLLWLAQVIFGILGAIKANNGEAYRYPFAIRLFK